MQMSIPGLFITQDLYVPRNPVKLLGRLGHRFIWKPWGRKIRVFGQPKVHTHYQSSHTIRARFTFSVCRCLEADFCITYLVPDLCTIFFLILLKIFLAALPQLYFIYQRFSPCRTPKKTCQIVVFSLAVLEPYLYNITL